MFGRRLLGCVLALSLGAAACATSGGGGEDQEASVSNLNESPAEERCVCETEPFTQAATPFYFDEASCEAERDARTDAERDEARASGFDRGVSLTLDVTSINPECTTQHRQIFYVDRSMFAPRCMSTSLGFRRCDLGDGRG